MTNKKAYILIYTILIITIIITLSSYIAKIYFTKKVNNYYVQDYLLKEKSQDNDNEVLLTKLRKYIMKNIQPLTADNAKKYFDLEKNYKDHYGKSYVKYVNQGEYDFLEEGLYFEIGIANLGKKIYKCILDHGEVHFIYITCERINDE